MNMGCEDLSINKVEYSFTVVSFFDLLLNGTLGSASFAYQKESLRS